MNTLRNAQYGYSIVEFLLASTIGLVMTAAVLGTYLAQSRLYKVSTSQNLLQSNENAITYIITPVVRAAGFMGCSATATAYSNLNSGGSNPLGSLNNTSALVAGYNGGSASITLTNNPANSTLSGDWIPALDATLVGNVVKGSDVLVLFGAVPNSYPLSITAIDTTTDSLTVQSTTGTTLSAGQYAAVSDCAKTLFFLITSVNGTTVNHASGTGALKNLSSNFPIGFKPGALLVPLQQVAFFVGQGHGGQSSLMKATLSGTSWSIQPVVPGVDTMKVSYGIGSNGVITNYVSANAVTNWAQVYAVRLGFLIEGKAGSMSPNKTSFNVLNTVVTVPSDNRLRYVYELTIYLRNALS